MLTWLASVVLLSPEAVTIDLCRPPCALPLEGCGWSMIDLPDGLETRASLLLPCSLSDAPGRLRGQLD